MNKQPNGFFEEQPMEIGLFTFYKEQQQDEELHHRENESKRRKKGKKYHSKPKYRYHEFDQFQTTSPGQSNVQVTTKNADCNDFLKNIRAKQQKKTVLSEIKEIVSNSVEGQIRLVEEEEPLQVSETAQKIGSTPNASGGSQQIKASKYELQLFPNLPSPSEHISAEVIRKKYFNNERTVNDPTFLQSSHKERIKDRIRTQITQQLQRNQSAYIYSAEQQLILPQSQNLQMIGKKELIKAPVRSFKEKMQIIQASHQIKVASERESSVLRNSKTSKELHEQNKRYFNNLMQNLYIRPQCNQTVYKILRDTLKLPQLSNSKKHLRTEGNSPQVSKIQLEVRSRSFYRNIADSPLRSSKQKQDSSKAQNFLKIAVKGKLLTQSKLK